MQLLLCIIADIHAIMKNVWHMQHAAYSVKIVHRSSFIFHLSLFFLLCILPGFACELERRQHERAADNERKSLRVKARERLREHDERDGHGEEAARGGYRNGCHRAVAADDGEDDAQADEHGQHEHHGAVRHVAPPRVQEARVHAHHLPHRRPHLRRGYD